jgi:hypothetical protein
MSATQPPIGLASLLVEMLVARDYDGAERLTGSRRLAAGDMRRVIEQYGRTLVALPNDAWSQASVLPISTSSDGEAWSVTLPVWTAEEGRSDLQIETRLDAFPDGRQTIQLDNIRVL